MQSFIEQIKKNFQKPLPGTAAQNKMAHMVRRHYRAAHTDARKAAVLGLLYPKGKDWHIVFIERQSSHPGDRHAGQIGFPGGTQEAFDHSIADTALRETEEEIGIPRQDIHLLGATTPLYIPVSNFEVFPFMGYLTQYPTFRPQASEVRAILEVPISHFSHPDTLKKKDIAISPNMTLRHVPFYDLQGKTLWGATAMMVSEMLEMMGFGSAQTGG
ncbi:MAG TPA: CoA pyrophosphatase [Phaeodactylibacter sp.]|nr:CoA pyrophosphatase [Phaeodactylibacter sp.]